MHQTSQRYILGIPHLRGIGIPVHFRCGRLRRRRAVAPTQGRCRQSAQHIEVCSPSAHHVFRQTLSYTGDFTTASFGWNQIDSCGLFCSGCPPMYNQGPFYFC
jgi:hypothetical protein